MLNWTGLVDAFNHPENYGHIAVFGVALLKTLALAAVGLLIIKIIMVIMGGSLRKSRLDPALHTFLLNALKVVLLIILITMCLSALGVHMNTIIAVIGAAGAAIALALKDSLANIAGGVMIIITQPFSRDDYIDVGDVSGKVVSIDLFLTTLRTYDNKVITIPNGIINTSVLVNHSREAKRRVDCTFSISYEDDIAAAKKVLLTVCQADGRIYKRPEPVIGVANHGESGVVMDLKAWCKTDDYWDVKYYLEEAVKEAFDKAGITIPYPHVEARVVRGE